LRPNRFSFVVSEELSDFAKEGLQGTPYGLYVCESTGPVSMKRAEYLHRQEAPRDVVLNILHKACVEGIRTGSYFSGSMRSHPEEV
jgi:hypothetical protein